MNANATPIKTDPATLMEPVGDAAPHCLVIDAHRPTADHVIALLSERGWKTTRSRDGQDGMNQCRLLRPDLIVVGQELPDGKGLDLLRRLRRVDSNGVQLVLAMRDVSIENVIEAMKQGAADCLRVPIDRLRFHEMLAQVELKRSRPIRAVPGTTARRFGLVGSAPGTLAALEAISRIAKSDLSAIILGERGVEKEAVARAIHAMGGAGGDSFLSIDCASLSPDLMESELFGHVRGAFPDAHIDREGLFGLVGEGTLFLDEVQALPPALQHRLRVVLREKAVRPVGAAQSFPFRGRVLAGSSADLARAKEEGSFDEELFYELHVLPVHLPPLRERREDVPALVRHFMDRYRRPHLPGRRLTRDARSLLLRYDWPGNVTELESVVRTILVYSQAEEVGPDHLPPAIRNGSAAGRDDQEGRLLEVYERQAVIEALSRSRGNRRQAARLLGISKTTLYTKLRKYSLIG